MTKKSKNGKAHGRVKSERGASRRKPVEQEPQVDLWAHGYGRAALVGLCGFIGMIEDRDYPNCTKMARDFAMSKRR